MTHPYPFPEAIDNTMRSAFVACPKQFWYSYIRKIMLDVPQIHLHAGGAFAAALHAARKSFYVEGHTQSAAECDGLQKLWEFYGDVETDTVKSWDRMSEALISYFSEYPFATDLIQPYRTGGHPAIEFNFALPLPINHPQTEEPILYAGRSDMVGVYNETGFIVDEKTTQRLGPTWAGSWVLRAQFMGYVWAARQWGWPIEGAMVRGICIYVDRIAHAQAIVYHPEWKIARWYTQLLADVQRMIDSWLAEDWQYNFSDACASYSGCAFSRLCELEVPEPFISLSYKENPWNPLADLEPTIKVA